ncbi:hypothetical protein Tco_0388295, partial [Tanacetum coccineum]
ASSDDRSSRINLLQELNKIDNLEALDLFQKSRIKCLELWISDPLHVKESFLNFFKEKFQPHVSSIDFPSISTSHGLNPSSKCLSNAKYLKRND